ncbi:hypothetical protein ONZ45_g19475 [Pleurotus djamor]|nr:hypothetical protein ONZ45_g19475 [Pleurotus djamor]
MDNPKKALEAKEKGNDAFKAGDYYSAIGHYTTAILNNRNDATFPLNRAAAYLKLGKNEDAERDCTTVLQQSKNNLKALFRRGQARAAMGNHKDAQADFEAILKLDAANSAAKLELQKIREILEKTKASKTTRVQTYVSNVVSEKDGRKLRRIPIKIVDDSPPPPPPSASTSVLASGDDLLKPVSTRPLAATQTRPPQVSDRDLKPVDTAKTPSPLPPPKPSTFQEAKQARTASKPSRVGGGIFRANGNHTIFSRSFEPMASSASAPAVAVPKTTPFVSLFDFSKAWFALSDQADRWNLLAQQAPPSCLPQLFQTSLEPPLLVSIFQTFEVALTADDASMPPLIRSYLDAFAQVPRIGTILLFLTKDEKALVLGVCDAVQAAEPGSFWSAVLKK